MTLAYWLLQLRDLIGALLFAAAFSVTVGYVFLAIAWGWRRIAK